MSLHVKFTEDGTGVIITAHGTFTVDEYMEAIRQSDELMLTVTHKVDVIIDLTDCPRLPKNVLIIFSPIAGRVVPLNFSGNLVMVGAKPNMMEKVRLYSDIFRKIIFIDALPNALKLLEEKRNQSGPPI